VSSFRPALDALDRHGLATLKEPLMQAVLLPGKDMVDVNKFTQLVDLYIYMPSAKSGNQKISPDIHKVLSSNT
jgi:hypothetical protein